MDLAKLARPWTAADGEIPSEWAQREYYGEPVIAGRIEELIGRISLFSTDGANVLRLWDPEHESPNVRGVLAGLELPSDSYSVALSPACSTPIESGYLECMHLVPAVEGIAAEAAIAAFARLQQDRYPKMERHLVDCYGTLTPERDADRRFRSIDYPAFDLGPVTLGLGLFAEHVRYRHVSIWCWSRVVNWHK
jgi:hypothetical protein